MLKASHHTSTLSASTFKNPANQEKQHGISKRELKERQIPHGLKGPFEVNLKKRIGRMIQHQGFT